jgi:CubicO group peptidase (beta-lactamase class C family)
MEDESMLQGGEGSFFNGYSVYGTGERGRVMIGHGGVGGSIALCDPATGTSVAVTLNRLSMDSSPTSGAILRLIFEQLNLPCPSVFKPKDYSGLEKMIKGKKLFSGVPTEQETEWRGKVTAR